MGFRDILEIYRLLRGHIRDLYVYVPSQRKKQSTNSTPTNFLRCRRNCYLVAWLILKHLLGLAGWPALFGKRVFLTLNSDLQSTCLTDCYLRWIQFELLASERWPVLLEIWKVETCFFSQKFGLQESTCTPATTRNVQLFRDGFFPGRFSACGSREALPCVRVHVIFCAIFAQPHCNRQLGL